MYCLVQTRNVTGTIVRSVLSNTEFIVPVAKTVGKIVDRAVDDYRVRNMEEVLTAATEELQSVERSPPYTTRPSKVPFVPESPGEPYCLCRRRTSSCQNRR